MFCRRFFLFFLPIVLFFVPLAALAAMSSTNYYIYADSIDGGGVLSASTSYSVQDTTGESPAGQTTSTSYNLQAGYQYMELGSLSMTLSASSVDLGDISVSAVSSGSTVVTITTNSVTGYSLSVGSVSGASLTAVADGTVTAGLEEYGLAVSGTDAAYATDSGLTAGLSLASSSGPVTDSATTLTFKAARSAGSATDMTYNQTVVLSVWANL